MCYNTYVKEDEEYKDQPKHTMSILSKIIQNLIVLCSN